jgi:hypothetical protein
VEAGEKPEEKAQSGAEDEARDDREVKSGVFAAVDDIAWQFAETEWEFAAEVKKGASENKKSAKDQKSAAEFAERVHKLNFSSN